MFNVSAVLRREHKEQIIWN